MLLAFIRMETMTVVLIAMLLGFLSSQQCMADVAYSHMCENCTDWCSASSKPIETANYAAWVDEDYGKVPTPGLDQALLRIMSKSVYNITIKSRSSECYKCDYQALVELGPHEHANVLMDTKHNTEFEVLIRVPKIPSPITVCSDSNWFLEYGNYTYHISPNDSTTQVPGYLCVLSSEDPPMDANIPVWVLIAVICILFAMWNVLLLLDRRYELYSCLILRTNRVITSDLGVPNSRSVSSNALNSDSGNHENEVQANGQATTSKIRLKSLDTFRGLSIVLMIFVNYGGGEYWYFKHAAWNGLTMADLVFPWFIFIMGTSMNFSFLSQIRRNQPWNVIFLRILKRSLILIILGLILNSKPRCPHRETMLENLRIPGVLQRIGVTYFLTSVIHLAFVYKQEASKVYHVLEFLVHLLLISVYLMLTFLLPVPGCPTGYLGPGGWAQFGQHQNCTGGAAGYIDRLIFGPSHIYSHPTSRRIYSGTIPYDPEGVLGCLTSTFLCYLGLQAGHLFNKPCWKPVRYQLLAMSIFSAGLGVLLCLGSKENGWIPINKNLWSLSYVLCMAGTGYFLLALTYLLVDRYKLWTGGPFVYAGMNAILLYLGHEIFHGWFPIGFHVHDDHWSQLGMDVWGTVFWIIVAYVLHLREIYFSI